MQKFKEFNPDGFRISYDKRGERYADECDAILTDFDLKRSFEVVFNKDESPDECEIYQIVGVYYSDGDFCEWKKILVFKGKISIAKEIETFKDYEIATNTTSDWGFLYCY